VVKSLLGAVHEVRAVTRDTRLRVTREPQTRREARPRVARRPSALTTGARRSYLPLRDDDGPLGGVHAAETRQCISATDAGKPQALHLVLPRSAPPIDRRAFRTRQKYEVEKHITRIGYRQRPCYPSTSWRTSITASRSSRQGIYVQRRSRRRDSSRKRPRGHRGRRRSAPRERGPLRRQALRPRESTISGQRRRRHPLACTGPPVSLSLPRSPSVRHPSANAWVRDGVKCPNGSIASGFTVRSRSSSSRVPRRRLPGL